MHNRLAILGGSPAFPDKVFITRPVVPEVSAFNVSIERIFADAILTNDGPFSRALQSALCERFGVDDCVLVSSGTDALLLAVEAFELRGSVVTTPFTHPSTVHAITRCGLEPVFADIDPETFNLDPSAASRAIDRRTAAILPVHTFGVPCDLAGFARLAWNASVPLIYDAAHAFEVSASGASLAGAGDASIYSFHATKVFSTAEGGAVVAKDPRRLARVRALRNSGYVDGTGMTLAGVNAKLSELHGAFGLATLPLLAEEIASRRTRHERYRRLLAGVPGVTFQRVPDGAAWNYSHAAILVDENLFGMNSERLRHVLVAEHIIARRYFSPICSELPMYRGLPSAKPDGLPVATRVGRSVLCLPLYGALPEATIDLIAATIAAAHEAADEIERLDQQSVRRTVKPAGPY